MTPGSCAPHREEPSEYHLLCSGLSFRSGSSQSTPMSTLACSEFPFKAVSSLGWVPGKCQEPELTDKSSFSRKEIIKVFSPCLQSSSITGPSTKAQWPFKEQNINFSYGVLLSFHPNCPPCVWKVSGTFPWSPILCVLLDDWVHCQWCSITNILLEKQRPTVVETLFPLGWLPNTELQDMPANVPRDVKCPHASWERRGRSSSRNTYPGLSGVTGRKC